MTNHVTRRTLLRGMGAALALPWMESLPAVARARPRSQPSRRSGCASGTSPTACICRPGFPSNEGALVDLPETLRPLSFAREYLNCFHGLTHNTALTNGDSEGCGHGQGSASFLTGAQAYKTQDAVRVGISADQLYARHVGNETRFPSLELGCESARSGNAFGYSGTYKTHISWRTPTSPAPYEMNPKVVFDRLFTKGSNSLTQATVADRDFYRKSMLDYVLDDANRIRDRVARSRSAQAGPVPDRRPRSRAPHPARHRSRRSFPGPISTGPRASRKTSTMHLRLMCDLMVLAFQTDSTRASSFMVTKEATDRNYPWLGFTDGHHETFAPRGRGGEEPQAPRDRPLSYLDPGLHDREDDDGRGSRRDDAARQLDGPLRQRDQRRRPSRPCQPAGHRARERRGHVCEPGSTSSAGRRRRCPTCCWRCCNRRASPSIGSATAPSRCRAC